MKSLLRDLSFENLFRRFIHLKICSGDFSFYEDVFMEIFPLKICSGDFSFYEDVFVEIFPFMKMYSWSFVHLRLKWRRFTPFRRFVHGDLSFEDLFRRLFLLKFCFGDFSFKDLWVLWKIVRRFVLFEICLRDLSFWKVC